MNSMIGIGLPLSLKPKQDRIQHLGYGSLDI